MTYGTRRIALSGIAFMTVGAFAVAFAAEPVGPKLTPRLKALLATEM